MRLTYQETDITPFVDIARCVYKDVSKGRSDSLDIELDHAATWHRWGPKIDDEINVVHGNLETGTMYLNTILPENGRYRIVATSLPSVARRKAWKSYHGMTLEEIMRACAAECRMDYRLYGLEGRVVYPYLERRDESPAAFLDRLMGLEGGVLKVINGRLCGISIEWAQNQTSATSISLAADQVGVQHIKQDGIKLAGLTVRTPWGEATAQDAKVHGELRQVVTDVPALDVVQAGRWARGLLLQHNRKTESICLQTQLDAGMTAMTRLDVLSATEMNGEWLVDESTHDLLNKKSRTTLLRCVYGIA